MDKLLPKKLEIKDVEKPIANFERISAAVPLDIKKKLDQLRVERNISPSQIVRALLKEFFEGLES